jgi:hypothetical protein
LVVVNKINDWFWCMKFLFSLFSFFFNFSHALCFCFLKCFSFFFSPLCFFSLPFKCVM